MKKLLIATTNPGKLQEIRRFLSDIPVELVSLDDVSIHEDINEDGKTFEENAIKKATFFARISGLPTIADDGGIEIDALDGAPGVHSRRWAGVENTIVHDAESDERIMAFTLQKLKDVPPGKRGAHMRTVMVFAQPNGLYIRAEGKIRGVIAEKPSERRYLGFPFRSLFFLPEVHKFYNHDELTHDENARYNHRKKAIGELIPKIKSALGV